MSRDPDWYRIEALLLAALERRKADFEISKRRFDSAAEQSKDLGLEHPDGRIAMYQAAKDYNAALTAYRDAVFDFNAFVLHSKIPDYLRE